ncbi:hypothetical protein [Thiohalorhabdus methylotrophus]|uniref:Lipoprotein n=1 Tax=Thiohalorhabdus methylotrophus TaxID=3242694 RepID=A0ABV4TZ06_9GAMM
MLLNLHRTAAALALASIALFWLSTVTVEAIGSPDAIAAVKRAILWGLLVLVPALIATNASGFRLARGIPPEVVRPKLRRAVMAAANGLLILVPAAFYLDALARAGSFGTPFVAVQALELVAGATNFLLLAANVRAGRRLHGRVAG